MGSLQCLCLSTSVQHLVTGPLRRSDYIRSSSNSGFHPHSACYKFCHNNNSVSMWHSFLSQNCFENIPQVSSCHSPPNSHPLTGAKTSPRAKRPQSLSLPSPLAFALQPKSVTSWSSMGLPGTERFSVNGAGAQWCDGMNVFSSNWLNALFRKEEILFSLISEAMRQNLTTLGSTHHFFQGSTQVSAACQPFRCLGLSHSFVEYKGSLWKFFLGTRSSSHAPQD